MFLVLLKRQSERPFLLKTRLFWKSSIFLNTVASSLFLRPLLNPYLTAFVPVCFGSRVRGSENGGNFRVGIEFFMQMPSGAARGKLINLGSGLGRKGKQPCLPRLVAALFCLGEALPNRKRKCSGDECIRVSLRF